MNIGVMQLAKINVSSTKQVGNQTLKSTERSQPSKFGEVFNNIVLSSTNNPNNAKVTESINIESLNEVLNAQSVEELLDLLGVPHEQGLLMLQVGDEGQAVAVDELMDINSLLDILKLDLEQLNTIVRDLLGDEDLEIFNIWQFVELVNEHAPKMLGELNAALQGEGNVTPKEAQTFLEFLKLTELAGKKSDLVGNQPEQLSQLKEMLSLLIAQTTKTTTQTETTVKSFVQEFQQVVTKTETTETQNVVTNTTQQTSTKTITITLPNTNQAAQSEALVKEIQNLINRSQISTSQGMTKLLLKLYPENLGSIRIEIMQKDGVLTARLLASTALGKELLDGQLHQLRNAFVQANIQMDRIDIAQSLQEADLKRDQNLFSNLFNQQQTEEEQDEEETNDEEPLSFKDFLMDEEV